MRDVICVSTQYWDGPKFRKHQFAMRMAEAGAKVLYVEPTHSVLRRTSYLGMADNPALVSRVRQVGDRLWIHTPRRVLPKPNVPAISALNRRLLSREVRAAADRLGIGPDPLLLIYDVEWAWSASALSGGPIVLDLVDDLVDYETTARRQDYIGDCIRELVEHASLSVFTTEPLMGRFARGGRTLVLPNGFDERLFNEEVQPEAISGARHPVIGFVGTLFRYIDYSALGAVADALPHATVVLVGRREGEHDALRALETRSNVIVMDPVEPGRVPGIVAGFDVCVSPFVAGGVADSVSPLKVYEYLALGKRVVCSRLAGVERDVVGPLIAFTDSSETFAAAVVEAIARPELSPGWQDVVSARSWSSLYRRLETCLVEIGAL